VRAALEFAARQGRGPQSCTHTTGRPVSRRSTCARSTRRIPCSATPPCFFTIHNLAYQGTFESDWLPRLDLGWDQLAVDRLEFYGRVSFLKGGINDARFVTTVSRRYAEEIQTPAFASDSTAILRARASDLVGILNGIDVSEWDPAHDSFLPNAVRRRRPVGQARREARAARPLRPARGRGCAEAAPHRDGVADGRIRRDSI